MSNKIQTIVLEDDVIEIFYNSSLSRNPYLIRFTNYYNSNYEIRANEDDIKELSEIFNKITAVCSRNGIDNDDNLE